jgi:hypothetical protein
MSVTKTWECNSCWAAAFAPTKILVSVNARGARGPELRILHAQDSFYAAFRYSPRDLPIFLSSLVSERNERGSISAMELALASGGDLTLNLNLRDKFNEKLTCQVSIVAGCSVTTRDSACNRAVSGRLSVLTIRSTLVTMDSTSIGLMVQESANGYPFSDRFAAVSDEDSAQANPSKKLKACDVPCDESDV